MDEYLQVVYLFHPFSISSYLRIYHLSVLQNGMKKFPLPVLIFDAHMSYQSNLWITLLIKLAIHSEIVIQLYFKGISITSVTPANPSS